MAKKKPYCCICHHSKEENVIVRPGLEWTSAKKTKEQTYICKRCDSFFQPVSQETNQQVIKVATSSKSERAFGRALNLADIIAKGAPEVLLADELTHLISRMMEFDLWDDFRNRLFSKREYPVFTDKQLVEMLVSIEMLLGQKNER
jgi:hypothetical protein